MALPTKPHGGYRVIPIPELFTAWCSYKRGAISWMGFRVYLALQEVLARREAAERSAGKPLATMHGPAVELQLQQLVGCARLTQVRASIVALESAGVLERAEGSLLPATMNPVSSEVADMLALTGRAGSVPFPRPVLRFLAAGANPATAAYALALVVRCCHVRRGSRYVGQGRCSSRLAAELFDVHPRSIKRAAAAMKSLGWAVRVQTRDRWTRRHGPVVTLNLNWRWSRTTLSPERARSRTNLSPPIRKQELLTDLMNQEEHVVPDRTERSRGGRSHSALRAVLREELRDVESLLRRYGRATQERLVSPTSAGRLAFVAAAQHARRVGERNPCGLFVTVIRRELWSYISQADEDAARRMLRGFEDTPATVVTTTQRSGGLGELVSSLAERLSLPDQRVPASRLAPRATARPTCRRGGPPSNPRLRECLRDDPRLPRHPACAPAPSVARSANGHDGFVSVSRSASADRHLPAPKADAACRPDARAHPSMALAHALSIPYPPHRPAARAPVGRRSPRAASEASRGDGR